MITLFTGMPGAGKTAAMVDALSKMSGNRPVYVHFDAAAKRDPEQVLLHESLSLAHHECNATNWPAELPHGAILVIDEVQDIWRPRGPGQKVPEAVAALETHRHTGLDVFLTTQSPRLLDINVRQLVGRHVHIRDTGILGRYWYEWPECNDSMLWKTCVNKRRYKLPKKAFSLYKSSSIHTVAVRGVPVAFYVSIGLLVLLAALVFGVYKIFQRPAHQPTPPNNPVMSQAVGVGSQAGPVHTVDERGPIDDRVAWIPRISSKPESAPAYDHLRVVRVMPIVQVGYCIADDCRCLTQQGTDAGLTQRECKQFVSKPPFDPYRVIEVAANGFEANKQTNKQSSGSGVGAAAGGFGAQALAGGNL